MRLALRTASSPLSQANSTLDCAVLEEFGGSFAFDLVSVVASDLTEADRVTGIFDFEAGLQSAEGDFAASGDDRERSRTAQIKVSAIPEIGLDDPPATDQAAVARSFHVEASVRLGRCARW
jgi:hypothetical protein